jgi:hypothetical protein
MTKAPATITYASVVSCETVCIALLMAALNDLNVEVGDVLNAYITAPITEKVWAVLGPEFSIDTSKSAIIVRASYGLKSAGAAFRGHLVSFMRQMGYTSCKADPDLWYKAETRPADNCRYWSVPRIIFLFVIHNHLFVICVCDAQICGPKTNFVFVNHKCIINSGLDFWWWERGGGSQHTNQPNTKQCTHLHPLIRWARSGRAAAGAAAAAAAKQLLCPAAVATKKPVATAMAGGGNNQQSTIN